MAKIGFGKKILNYFFSLYKKNRAFLALVCRNYAKYNILSAGTVAFFVVLFLFFTGVNSASAAENANFLIDPAYDITSRSSINATNRVTGLNAYFYIEDDYWLKLSPAEQNTVLQSINALAGEFDKVIYPKMQETYGAVWNPGIDNDSKIYILLTNIVKDAGGYYNPNDEYFKIQVKDNRSNEKEIIYLNTDFIGKSSLKAFLAHELQHMINWHQKKKISGVDEEVWLNEGLSEYSSTLLGYDNPYSESVINLRATNFLQRLPDSLTEWQNINNDYASVNLFMQYMADHYGKNILKSIIDSKKTGIAAVNDSLQNLNFNTDFSEVFSDWQIANYLNDKKIYNGKYAYLNPVLNYDNFHVKPTETLVVQNDNPIKSIEYVKDWSGRWYRFTSPLSGLSGRRALKIAFSADDPASDFKISYIIKNTDGAINIGSLKLDSLQTGTAVFEDFNTKIDSGVILPVSEKKSTGFTESEPLIKFSYTVSLVDASMPIISNINPARAPIKGGTLATIIGENFNTNSVVKFGGIAAEIRIPDSKTIIAKIPPSLKSGNVNVEVINSASSSATAAQSFTYFSLPEDGSLIRAIGDYKVYVISGNYKRWIQSAEIFKYYPHFGWNAVLAVSPQIRDYYHNSHLVRADGDYKVYEVNTDNSKHHLSISAEQFSASGRSWDMIFTVNKMERNFYKTGSTITK